MRLMDGLGVDALVGVMRASCALIRALCAQSYTPRKDHAFAAMQLSAFGKQRQSGDKAQPFGLADWAAYRITLSH